MVVVIAGEPGFGVKVCPLMTAVLEAIVTGSPPIDVSIGCGAGSWRVCPPAMTWDGFTTTG